MKILFVIDRQIDRGSIQAVANYVRAGKVLGHDIAVYGRETGQFTGLRFSTEAAAFDRVVFIVESWRGWMSGLRMPRLLASVPREQRAILDADGMYNPVVCIDGYDRNVPTEADRMQWRAHYQLVSDRIMQPTLQPVEPGVRSVLFYGYDPSAQIRPEQAPSKRYDILHVGHNWWRWRQISESLLPALEKISDQVGDVCFCGSWWESAPTGAKELGLEAAFVTGPEEFRRLRIQVKPPVPFTEVVSAMSEGWVNLMTQRPLFRHLKLLTSKYFEVFTADTIPLVMVDPEQAASIYGPAGGELALWDGIADKLIDVLSNPHRYSEIVEEVRRHLAAHHSYQNRLRELIAALEEPAPGY